jgi:hypothetical protein
MLVDELDNFDEVNIAAVKEKWAKENSVKHEICTLIETNMACDVEITEESMRLCAEALLK